MRELTFKEALQKAQSLSSQREISSNDIYQKLRQWGVLEEEIQTIIEQLIAEKFLDNERFATAFARDKVRFQKWGKMKIAYQLRTHRVESSVISAVLNQLDDDEYCEMIRDEIEKKLRTEKEKDKQKLKAKLFRFAQSRGYETEIAMNVFKEFLKNREE